MVLAACPGDDLLQPVRWSPCICCVERGLWPGALRWILQGLCESPELYKARKPKTDSNKSRNALHECA